MSSLTSMFKDTTGEQIHMFRSEPMEYIQFVFPREAAYQSIYELGKLGIVHFEDMNPSVNPNRREFIGEIKRCDEMQRYLRFFRSQLVRAGMPPNDDYTLKQFSFSDLEAKFDELDKNIRFLNTNQDTLRKNRNEYVELKYVLKLGAPFFSQQPELAAPDTQPIAYQSSSSGQSVKLGTIAGVIPYSKLDIFQRMCFVVTRGNVFINTVPIEEKTLDVVSNTPVEKVVFVTFFSGEHTQNRIMRIAESLSASVYDFRESASERELMLQEIDERLDDLQRVSDKTDATLNTLLTEIQKEINAWQSFVVSEKQLFVTLNMFSNDTISKCLVGEGWIPTRSLAALHEALHRASVASASTVPSIANIINTKQTGVHLEGGAGGDEVAEVSVAMAVGADGAMEAAEGAEYSDMKYDAAVVRQRAKEMRRRRSKPPPTYIRTTKVTQAFQAIVNSYGIGTYREINPGLITFVTFPFLFGIMFGDFGHGLLLALVALYFVLAEKKLGKKNLDDLIEYLYTGRYMILLMGLMAAYCGFMYNECFSLSMNWFGSSWDCDKETGQCIKKYTYWLGMDPIWRQSSNNLIFSNSVKMKLSMIVGVLHMIFGICFSGLNAVYFKSKIDFWCEFVPQIIMMVSLFGYMCFMIIYKWLFITDRNRAPMLIRTMINMFLSFMDPIPDEERLYNGQEGVQRFLLFLVVIAVPWMLIPKPAIEIYLHLKEEKKKKEGKASEGYSKMGEPSDGTTDTSARPGNLSSSSTSSDVLQTGDGDADGDDGENEFNIGELIVNQLIETIEFSLNTVSNTASYLRLWALSLAHGQLAEVFFDYGMVKAGQIAGPFGMIFGVPVWIGATVAILLAMEGLSAFLHALRLHWVELQNKFYKALGRPFQPLAFSEMIREESRANQDFENMERDKVEKNA